ncbi:MAG: phosphatidylglycerophosphatase A [Acidimicrobiia bacterium]|nr:phosphatidylglycerophosphatase A [Acidimicrobiia bacterium]
MHRLVASWFGSGLLLRRIRGSDYGSGTVGAALTLVLALGLGWFGWWAQALAAVGVAGLSVWSANRFADEGDPGWIVVDEAAGMLLATIGLTGWPVLISFFVFRAADIFKATPGVGAAERLPGGLGITADDLVAGLYGLAAGWVFQAWVF